MQKDEILAAVNAGHKKIESALAALSPDQMETPSANGGWTVKETLVHMTFWELQLLEDFAVLKRGETPVELNGQEGIDAVNAGTISKAKTMQLASVLEDFKASFRQLTAWLEELDPVDLNRPFMYGLSLEEFIAEDTWKHYAEHLPLLNSKIMV